MPPVTSSAATQTVIGMDAPRATDTQSAAWPDWVGIALAAVIVLSMILKDVDDAGVATSPRVVVGAAGIILLVAAGVVFALLVGWS